MGVPRLYKWILDRYSRYVRKISNVLPPPANGYIQIDNFYIDANPIIHECCQKIFNYGNMKRLLDPNKNKTYAEKELMVFNLFFQKILSYMKLIKINKLVYIAIDGCAPAGKMMQQRQRRFISAQESSVGDAIPEFTTSFISVGTEFMERLRTFMDIKLVELFEESDTNLKNIKIIFSPASVAGEGEHKIMEYLRNDSAKTLKESHCMYGPDGDLIMLTLAHETKKFYLLRPEQDDPLNSSIIDMTLIRGEIAKDIDIFDFIFLGFLVGNDFLPKIQMFDYLENGMDTIFKIYHDIVSTAKITLTDKNRNINFGLLKKFIGELSKLEEMYLRGQAVKEISQKSYENYICNNMMNSCVSETFSGGQHVMKTFDYKKYRGLYNGRMNESPEKCVKDYLQTLDWVFKYYTKECQSFKFFYPHYYAPLMTDFYKEFPKVNLYVYDKGELVPHEPFKQLLAILPAKSKYLLPKELHSLMTDKNSPLKEMYVDNFAIDYEGKYQKHQGIAILPMIDYDLLSEVYEEYKPLIKKYRRNQKGKVRTFTYSEKSKKYTFTLENKTIKSFVLLELK